MRQARTWLATVASRRESFVIVNSQVSVGIQATNKTFLSHVHLC
jgi:hypothetical protein